MYIYLYMRYNNISSWLFGSLYVDTLDMIISCRRIAIYALQCRRNIFFKIKRLFIVVGEQAETFYSDYRTTPPAE